jgi:peptide/nickel transport system ATP-binding protein
MAAIPDMTQDRERLNQIDGAHAASERHPPGVRLQPALSAGFRAVRARATRLVAGRRHTAACWLHAKDQQGVTA